MESSQIVTIHIQSVDQNEAIKTVKHTITELDRSKIEEQKKAVRAGYDMDIIPSDLATFGKDAKALLKELQSQNERMFLLTFLIMNTGRTEQELENNVFQAKSIAQKHNCNLVRLDFQQEQGFMSSLPLAQNLIEIHRGMTTSSTAIFVSFTTQELFQSGDESLYYGLNALSNNLIMVDRKLLKNPNGLVLGTPGSGKSFAAKRKIANAFLVSDDDAIISDPEAEYSPLVERFGGQVIKISPTSTQYINPMDINMNYSDDDSEKFSNDDGEIIFYVTNKKLAEYMGKGNSQKKIDKINKYVKMLIYHDLIRILDNDQIPKELLKNALKYTNGNKNRVNFYAIPSWVVQQLKTIEDNGIRWKDKGYRIGGVSFDMFYRSEGFEVAASLYPQYKKKKNEYGEIVNRTTTKASDERTLKISEVILHCIQRKGYCTEKEVVYILGNEYRYEVTETQIKRCLNEIMDCYGLKKVKANKVLKEQFDIKSDGYPYIIIEDEM